MRKRTCWTVPSMAEYLCVTEDTIRAWLRAGKIAHVRLPDGQYRVRDDHFQIFLIERTRSGRMERAKRGRAGVALAGSVNATPGVAGLLDGSNV